VFCSDLGRAAETARIAFGGRGVPILHDWRLRECNYGMLNGTAVARLEVERTMHVVDPYSGGESYTAVVARVRRFLQDIPSSYTKSASPRSGIVTKWVTHPRGDSARRARRGLVSLAAGMALHARDRRLSSDRGTYSDLRL
jgi:broad specificity phosphatase PhoE